MSSAEPERRAVRLIDVPYDHGHERRGSGLGPEAILGAGAEDALAASSLRLLRSTVPSGAGPELPGTEIARTFAVNRALAGLVAAATAARETPLVLAGNCNSCLGTVAGTRSHVDSVVWFDGHPDLDTPETSTSGFFGGMALAALTGSCWQALCESIPGFRPIPPDRVALVGIRHLSAVEEEAIASAGITRAEVAAFDDLPAGGIYLHVDLDVLDPAVAHANPWAAAGGLEPDELVEAVRRVCASRHVTAAALTAYDPAGDRSGIVAATACRVLAAIGEVLR
jgi:arginase